MNCVRFLRAGLPILILPLLAAHAHAGSLLSPDRLKVGLGSVSDQGVGVLAAANQTGSSDGWKDYLEIYPSRDGFRGVLTYALDGDRAIDDVDALHLVANWRGPQRSLQRWRLRAKNVRTGLWRKVLDNTGLHDWRWQRQRAAFPGEPSDWIDSFGRIRLQVVSESGSDNLNIDSLQLDVRGGEPPPRSRPLPSPPPLDPRVWRPAPGTSWQWQLTGTIDTSLSVDMYDIDLFDAPRGTIDRLQADGRVVICYFSAGSSENWRPDHEAFPASVQGRGNGWAGERWLDIRRLDVLGPLMAARLDLALEKGCDGVEPDNVDGYTNTTGFALAAADQLRFNRWLAKAAHARGLSIGLKNDVEQAAELEPWFDWALNEQCVFYEECEALLPFIRAGKAVFGVEYQGDPDDFCAVANALDMDWLDKEPDLGVRRTACR